MWKHIRRVVLGGGLIGGATFWLSTNSIPETIANADGYLGANLKFLGWSNPPAALATTAADHTGAIVGLILMAMGGAVFVLWAAERMFGAKEIAQVPSVIREFIYRNMHHKEFLAQIKGEASMALVVHRASEVTAWQPLCEAIRYLVYETQWAGNQPAPTNESQFNASVALELRERLARGEVRARGKLGLSGDSLNRTTEMIPLEFWTNAFLQPHGEIVLCDAERGLAVKEGGGTAYRAIVVAKNDVELVWPRRSPDTKYLTPLAQFVEPQRQAIVSETQEEKARKRKLIDDCRLMVAEWDGGHGHSAQRADMEKNPSFLALRRHLPQYFLDHLDKNIAAEIDTRRPHQPVAMGALGHHLDRLEEEWGL